MRNTGIRLLIFSLVILVLIPVASGYSFPEPDSPVLNATVINNTIHVEYSGKEGNVTVESVYYDGTTYDASNYNVSQVLEKKDNYTYKFEYNYTANQKGTYGVLLNVTGDYEAKLFNPSNTTEKWIKTGPIEFSFMDAERNFTVNYTEFNDSTQVGIYTEADNKETIVIDPVISATTGENLRKGSHPYIDDDGSVHIGFANGTEVWYANSTDGSSWNYYKVTDQSNAMKYVTVSIQNDGTPVFGMLEGTGAYGCSTHYYQFGVDGTLNQLNSVEYRDQQIITDDSGFAHLVVGGSDPNCDTTDQGVYYTNLSQDTTLTYMPNSYNTAGDTDRGGSHNIIALNDSNVVHIMERGAGNAYEGGDDQDIRYYNNAGGSFTYYEVEEQSGAKCNLNGMSLYPGNTVHATYWDAADGNLYYSDDIGATETTITSTYSSSYMEVSTGGDIRGYLDDGSTFTFYNDFINLQDGTQLRSTQVNSIAPAHTNQQLNTDYPYSYVFYQNDSNQNLQFNKTLNNQGEFPDYLNDTATTDGTDAGTLIEHSLKWFSGFTDFTLSGYIFGFYNGSETKYSGVSGDLETGTVTKSVSASMEYRQPTTSTDDGGETTNPANAHDWNFQSNAYTNTNANANPSITWHGWESNTTTYGSLHLNMKYSADSATDDTYEYRYSTNGGGSWTTWIGPTSNGAAQQNVTIDIADNVDTSQVQVQIVTTKQKGPDNADVYTWELWTNGSTTQTDANTSYTTYEDTITDTITSPTTVNTTVYISGYDSTASTNQGSDSPDVWLQVYDGSSWVDVGSYGVSGTGNYSLQTTVSGWDSLSNRDVRLKGTDLDATLSSSDQIDWTGVYVEANSSTRLVNDTFTSFPNGGQYDWSNVTKYVNETSDTKIEWKIWANNSQDLWNASETYTYTTTQGTQDTEPPQWRNQEDNATSINAGQLVNMTAEWNDISSGVDYVRLATNETGAWENKTGNYSSPLYLGTGADTWERATFLWSNSSFEGRMCWKQWANDTAGNWNSTDTLCFDSTKTESYQESASESITGADDSTVNITGLEGYQESNSMVDTVADTVTFLTGASEIGTWNGAVSAVFDAYTSLQEDAVLTGTVAEVLNGFNPVQETLTVTATEDENVTGFTYIQQSISPADNMAATFSFLEALQETLTTTTIQAEDVTRTYTEGVQETVTAAFQTSNTIDVLEYAAETFTLTDQVLETLQLSEGLSQTFTTTAVQSEETVKEYFEGLQQSNTLTGQVSTKLSAVLGLQETGTATVTPGIIFSPSTSLQESLTLTSTQLETFSPLSSPQQTISLTESTGFDITFNEFLQQTLTPGIQQSETFQPYQAIIETVTSTDTVAKNASLLESPEAAITATVTESNVFDLDRAFQETMSPSTLLGFSATFKEQLSQSNTVQFQVLEKLSTSLGFQETPIISLIQGEQVVKTYDEAIQQTLSSTEQVGDTFNAVEQVLQTFTLTDAATTVFDATVSIQTPVTYTSLVSATVSASEGIQLTLSETAQASVASSFNEFLQETGTLTTVQAPVYNPLTGLQEAVSHNSGTTVELAFVEFLQDTATYSFIQSETTDKIYDEAIQQTSTITSTVTGLTDFSQGRQQTITGTEFVAETFNAVQSASQSLTLTLVQGETQAKLYREALQQTSTLSQAVASTVSFTDSIQIQPVFSDTVSDVFQPFTGFQDTVTPEYSVGETFNAFTSVQGTVSYTETLAGTISQQIGLQETGSSTETVTLSLDFLQPHSQTVSYLQAMAKTLSASEPVQETLTVSIFQIEYLEGVEVLSESVGSSVQTGFSVDRLETSLQTVSPTMSAAETLSATIRPVQTLTVSTIQGEVQAKLFIEGVQQSIAGSFQATSTVDFVETASETLTPTSSATEIFKPVIDAFQTLTLSTVQGESQKQIFEEGLQQATVFDDAVYETVERTLGIQEDTTVTVTQLEILQIVKGFSQQISASTLTGFQPGYLEQVGETGTVQDTASTIYNPFTGLTQGITLETVTASTSDLSLSLQETLQTQTQTGETFNPVETVLQSSTASVNVLETFNGEESVSEPVTGSTITGLDVDFTTPIPETFTVTANQLEAYTTSTGLQNQIGFTYNSRFDIAYRETLFNPITMSTLQGENASLGTVVFEGVSQSITASTQVFGTVAFEQDLVQQFTVTSEAFLNTTGIAEEYAVGVYNTFEAETTSVMETRTGVLADAFRVDEPIYIFIARILSNSFESLIQSIPEPLKEYVSALTPDILEEYLSSVIDLFPFPDLSLDPVEDKLKTFATLERPWYNHVKAGLWDIHPYLGQGWSSIVEFFQNVNQELRGNLTSNETVIADL